MSLVHRDSDELPSAVADRVNSVCDRFEAAWKAAAPTGSRPHIEDYLADTPEPERQLLLRELLALDVAFRRRSGEEPAAEEYRSRFPDYAELLRSAFHEMDLVRPAASGILDSERHTSPDHASRAALAADAPEAAFPLVGTPTSSGLRFRILRPHAKGGLGQVSVALDQELPREVALKEIQEHHADDPESQARFLREAEITGGLEHPGIVPVYGLGRSGNGRPFYVMRFIKGDNFQEAIRRFHEADERGRDPSERSLALRQLLRRFLDVCNAVAYAHSRGVLHRDLKPGNVMLGKYGETLVVDWGLAKSVAWSEYAQQGDETARRLTWGSGGEVTQPGQGPGTPAFMSPEQTAGRMDLLGPASDIYSLGATLYVLLTGKAPLPRGNLSEALQQVQCGDWLTPRQVKPGTPPALDAICRKAMALKREDRYSTVLALAADVEQWLADEPVSAYSEPWTARARRWVRKHPGTVSGVAAAILVGLVGLGVSAALLGRKNQQLGVAHEQATRARDRTFDVLDAMTSSVTGESLQTQVAISAEQKKFLTEVLTFYQEIAAEQGADEVTRKRIAAVAYRVGLIHYRLGNREAGVRAFEQARDSYAKLAADFPDTPEYRRDLAMNHDNLAVVLGALGRRSEEERRQALALWEKLVAEFPAVPEYRWNLARSQNNLGLLLRNLGQWPEAEKALRQGLAGREALAAEFPTVSQYREDLARSLNNLGLLLRDLGQWPEAEKALRRALDLRKKLATDFPAIREHSQYLAHSHNDLGILLHRLNKRHEAKEEFQQALPILEKLVASFPTVPQYRQELAHSRTNLGVVLHALGKLSDAEAESRQALAIYEKLAADFPTVPEYRRDLAGIRTNRAGLLHELNNLLEAETELQQAQALLEELIARSPNVPAYRAQLAGNQEHLGRVLLERGKPAEALACQDRVLALLKALLDANQLLPSERQLLWHAHAGRAVALDRLERPAEAVADWDQAVELAPAPQRAEVRAKRARCLIRAGQVERAVAEATDLAKAPESDAKQLYRLACVYSLAAGRDETNRAVLIRDALQLLRRAVARGFKDVEQLTKYDDLKLLRDQEEFRQLLAELQGK